MRINARNVRANTILLKHVNYNTGTQSTSYIPKIVLLKGKKQIKLKWISLLLLFPFGCLSIPWNDPFFVIRMGVFHFWLIIQTESALKHPTWYPYDALLITHDPIQTKSIFIQATRAPTNFYHDYSWNSSVCIANINHNKKGKKKYENNHINVG